MSEEDEEEKRVVFHGPRSGEIPPIFLSDLDDKPILHCSMCERDLLTGDTPYMIEKGFKVYRNVDVTNTIFEVAICFECHERMRQELSKESLQKLDEYAKKRANLDQRREQLIQSSSTPSAEEWMNSCVFTGEEQDELEEFHIYGQFHGDKLMYYDTPFIISGTSIEEMQELLSKETRDELDDFMRTHVGGPPEFEEILNNGHALLI